MRHRKTLEHKATGKASDPVTRYASEVVAGRQIAGKLVRLACKRHLTDLGRADLTWNSELAQRAIQFFPDVLCLAEGEHAGKPFILQPWQAFIVGSLFGWLGLDGFRRFRNAYVEIGKGNGKSPMAGGIGLYMMLADSEAGAHCFAAAVTREQASILFQDAVKMVDASPALTRSILKSGKSHVFNLAHLPSGSFFRAVSSEGRGLDGKRVHYAALDEIHEHPNATVVEKMRAGTKGRRQALIFEITNSGYDRHSICWQHHEYSEKVLDSHIPNDGWFAYVCQLDEGDDWKDERVWTKVNPNLEVSITHKYLREQVEEATGMPGKENIVKRLNFCIWTEQAKRWISMEKWDACVGKVDAEALVGELCYGGLDLALTTDLSALILLFPPSETHDDWKLLPFFWCAEESITQRSKRDHVPYDVWRDKGFLIATSGETTDFDFIEAEIGRICEKYTMLQIGIDKALAAQLVNHIRQDHPDPDDKFVVQIPQGALTMNSPVRTIEKLILEKELSHGGHPVLRWNASNAVLRQDSNGNVKFDKERAVERIDGMTALGDAMWCALAGEGEGYVSSKDLMFV